MALLSIALLEYGVFEKVLGRRGFSLSMARGRFCCGEKRVWGIDWRLGQGSITVMYLRARQVWGGRFGLVLG